MQKIGFIGLGRMGAPMARRFLAAGYPLTVFDLNTDILASLGSAGAQRASSPRGVADAADIVFTSLPTPDVVKACVLGENGISGGSARIFVDLSTTGPRVSVEIAAALELVGITAVDAPVSGGVRGATAGTLSLMVAAPATVFAQIEAVLAVLGKPTLVSEAAGAGQTVKLANNLLAATALAITAEACTFGVKAGLDPAVMCEIFSRSSGINTATLEKFPKSVFTGTFDFGFATGLAYKDLRLCLDEAEALGVPTPVGAAVRQMFAVTQAMYGADSDFTSVVRPLETWAGIEVRSNRAPMEGKN